MQSKTDVEYYKRQTVILSDNVITSTLRYLLAVSRSRNPFNLVAPFDPTEYSLVFLLEEKYSHIVPEYKERIYDINIIRKCNVKTTTYYEDCDARSTYKKIEITKGLIYNNGFRYILRQSSMIHYKILKFYKDSMDHKIRVFMKSPTFSKPLKEALEDGFKNIHILPGSTEKLI